MAKFNQFGSAAPGLSGGDRDCLRYEAMLADVLDGVLSREEQAAFDRHRETCDSCSEMLKDAQRGAAWLALLKPERPEPSSTLVTRILAETSVRAAAEAEAVRATQRAVAEAASLLGSSKAVRGPASVSMLRPVPATQSSRLLAFRTRLPGPFQQALNTTLQPRFAMTAAMAFFSIALTLNLTGIRVRDLHAHDLRPASLRRGFYEANAHIVRYYENLRVVYELESRVRDLQHTSDADPASAVQRPSDDPVGPDDRPDDRPDSKTPPSAAPTQTRPAGKPHSGLSRDSEGHGRTAATQLRQNEIGVQSRSSDRDDADHVRRHATSVVPTGAIFPVSLSRLSPHWQKRGLA